MRVLVVCSGTRGIISPYITEQIKALRSHCGVEFGLFQIRKGGWLGYISHFKPLLKVINRFNPDIIHAHYGLCGFLAILQRRIPVVTTFHGSDINDANVYRWSRLAHLLSAASIFVEKSMMDKIRKHKSSYIIPCGVDLSVFYPFNQQNLIVKHEYRPDKVSILIYSGIGGLIKNFSLAREACNMAEKKLGVKINIVELRGFSRDEVSLLLNTSDCFLLYSSSEGSPQVIKEAMACNCPIVTTDVGDVRWIIGDTKGCFIAFHDLQSVSDSLVNAVIYARKFKHTNGRDRIVSLGLDNSNIAKRVFLVYNRLYNSPKINSRSL